MAKKDKKDKKGTEDVAEAAPAPEPAEKPTPEGSKPKKGSDKVVRVRAIVLGRAPSQPGEMPRMMEPGAEFKIKESQLGSWMEVIEE